ncbi:MAG: hypothetical protein ACTSSF_08750, partial [Candidatus Heimdallarchaeaceae archaeon]
MAEIIIKAAPDYLPLNLFEFKGHFLNLFSFKKYELSTKYEDYTRILGYSCRSLFEVCMKFFLKEDLVLATTPLHHTSFRNIIEKYVKPENIKIIELNDKYNEIVKLPETERCDLIVVTHLFGQDLDLSVLTDFKKKHKCIIIEDRVQGGSLDKGFSSDSVDVAFYSMGMDKRPIALGGGFIYIKNSCESLIQASINTIKNLPKERRINRFLELIKKVPTFLFYNSRLFIYLTIKFLRFLHFFNKRITLLSFTNRYRTANPGFSHHKYMFYPSKPLFKSIYKKIDRCMKIEQKLSEKHSQF